MSEQESKSLRAASKEILDALNEIRKIEGHPPLTEAPELPYCSFCGRFKNEVGALVEGYEAHICMSCADEARRLLQRSQ